MLISLQVFPAPHTTNNTTKPEILTHYKINYHVNLSCVQLNTSWKHRDEHSIAPCILILSNRWWVVGHLHAPATLTTVSTKKEAGRTPESVLSARNWTTAHSLPTVLAQIIKWSTETSYLTFWTTFLFCIVCFIHFKLFFIFFWFLLCRWFCVQFYCVVVLWLFHFPTWLGWIRTLWSCIPILLL